MIAGARVATLQGPGTVIYVRMRPPLYAEAEALCVRLDARAGVPGYTGTIYRVADVAPVVAS